MIAALVRLPFARLTRTRRAVLPLAGWTLVAIIFAVVARNTGGNHAADQALLGPFAAVVLPLVSFGLVAATFGGESIRRASAPLVSFGASPIRAALASIAVAALASAIAGALIGAIVAATAHAQGDPPLAKDMFLSAYAGVLGGAAYAAYFAFGSTFGARGIGRSVLLVVDAVFGGTGSLGLFTPRAHVRNLLGGAAPVELAQRASAVLLLFLVVLYVAAAVRRARR